MLSAAEFAYKVTMLQPTYLLYPALLAVCAGIWYQQVKNTVPEPYLVSQLYLDTASNLANTSLSTESATGN